MRKTTVVSNNVNFAPTNPGLPTCSLSDYDEKLYKCKDWWKTTDPLQICFKQMTPNLQDFVISTPLNIKQEKIWHIVSYQ